MSAERYFNAGVAAFRRGDFVAAVGYYLHGLERAPRCVPAYLDLAKAYEHLGEWNAALEALEIALQLAPDHPTGIRRRQRILEEKKTFDFLAQRLEDKVCFAFQDRFLLTVSEGVEGESKEIAARALSQAYWEIGTTLEAFPVEPVMVHLLPSRTPMRRPLWAAGLALEEGTLLVFLRQPRPNAGLLTALLRHEYGHFLVRSVAGGRCPAWLDEAIAEHVAKPRMSWEEARLNRAIAENRWIPLRKLVSPFANLPPEEVSLAYTECGRIGDYLAKAFGTEVFRWLLVELRGGRSVEEALSVVCDLDVAVLEMQAFCLPIFHAATA